MEIILGEPGGPQMQSRVSHMRERQNKMWYRQKRSTLRGEGHVKMEPEMGVTQPQDREYWQPPEAGRGKAQILPPEPSEVHFRQVNMWILGRKLERISCWEGQ